MYQVLVVEDELWNRRGIVKCIEWERLGMSLIAEAGNGEEALQALERGGVDVVVTDMKMPVCDGRRMLQEIERRGYDCEIIVLSEYSDFEYMRQAIHAHVYEYILKPIDERELNDVLRRVGERLNSRRAGEGLPADPLSELFACATAKSTQSHALLSAALETHSAHFSGQRLRVACLQLGRGGTAGGPPPAIEPAVQSGLPDTRLFPCDSERGVYCLVSLFPEGAAGENGREYGLRLKTFFEDCRRQFGEEVRIGLPGRRTCKAEDLLSSMKCALTALQFLRRGEGGVISYESVERLTVVPDVPLFDEKQLTGLLQRGREADGEHLKQTILQSLREAEYTYVPAMRKSVLDFTLTLEKCCRREGCAVNISSSLNDNYIDRIGRLEWLGELEEFLTLAIGCVMQAVADRRSQRESDVIGEIIHQLELCYAEEISLMAIAQKHHINYIYLSRLFKERTGVNFTDFLLSLRMKKARELIEHGGFKIKDVAQLVGYTNPYYFITSYRKYFGNAPSEDKRRAGGAEESL